MVELFLLDYRTIIELLDSELCYSLSVQDTSRLQTIYVKTDRKENIYNFTLNFLFIYTCALNSKYNSFSALNGELVLSELCQKYRTALRYE